MNHGMGGKQLQLYNEWYNMNYLYTVYSINFQDEERK